MNLSYLRVIQLKKLCKDYGLKKYSRLRKQELIELLTSKETKSKETQSMNLSFSSLGWNCNELFEKIKVMFSYIQNKQQH